jgi:DNA-binding MarR family transcriptional regulator
MNEKNKYLELIFKLLNVSSLLKNKLMDALGEDVKKSGIKKSEFIVLFNISHNGPKNMSSLEKLVDIKMGSLTSVIDNLIEKGLVKRIADVSDRRIINISLTSNGIELFKKIRKDIDSKIIKKIQALSEEDLGLFTSTIDNLGELARKL